MVRKSFGTGVKGGGWGGDGNGARGREGKYGGGSGTAAVSCWSAAGPKEAARLAIAAVVASQAASTWTMGGKTILNKCEAFIRKRIKTLEEIYSSERKLV